MEHSTNNTPKYDAIEVQLDKPLSWAYAVERELLTGSQVTAKEAMPPKSLTPTHSYIDKVSRPHFG